MPVNRGVRVAVTACAVVIPSIGMISERLLTLVPSFLWVPVQKGMSRSERVRVGT